MFQLVSFFMDISSEMIYPLVPLFLANTLGISKSTIGLIEGIAEGTAAIGKFNFGYLSDKVGKRKPFVVSGYSFSTVSKILISLASSWPLVLLARFIDRLGKGVRTSARDSLLLQNTTKKNKGFIFGYHRAFDSAGAVIGPIIGLTLIYFFKENLRLVFYFATIPVIIGVLLLIFFVKEKVRETRSPVYSTASPQGGPRRLSQNGSPRYLKNFAENFSLIWNNKKLLLFFIASIIFSLGNSSDAFLIWNSSDLP